MRIFQEFAPELGSITASFPAGGRQPNNCQTGNDGYTSADDGHSNCGSQQSVTIDNSLTQPTAASRAITREDSVDRGPDGPDAR